MSKYPIYIALPGMEVYLAESLLLRQRSRVQPLHSHIAYELLCIQEEDAMIFRVIPPFYEHLGADASRGNVISLLFSFTQSLSGDICQSLQGIKDEPISFRDDFQGCERVRNVKQLVQDLSQPGVYERLAAELRLLFVCIAQKQSHACNSVPVNHQTLDNKRLAIMEDFFSLIGISDPDCNKTKLAEKLGVSERQLTRILDQTYHLKFSELVLRTRMRIAHANIIEGSATLERIAEHVGYRSVAAFKRAYREYFGVSLQNYQVKP